MDGGLFLYQGFLKCFAHAKNIKKPFRSRKESQQPTASPPISPPSNNQSSPAVQPQEAIHSSQGADTLVMIISNFQSPPQTIGEGQEYRVRVLHDNSKNACVNTVFVHGLTGNAYSTWLHKETGIHWPSQLLGQDVPVTDQALITRLLGC